MDISQGFITFLRSLLLTMVPFVLAAQGTMLAGRTGVFIVAQEGIMLTSASVGFIVSYKTGSLFYGMLAALLVGGGYGVLIAYMTTTLKMNQFVIGLSFYFVG
ncbi:MAG: ABC transporter permease, partial [Anaerolineales bacterium]